jgi:hypothetical protein
MPVATYDAPRCGEMPGDRSRTKAGQDHYDHHRRSAGSFLSCSPRKVALGRLPSPQYPVVHDLEGSRFITAQSAYARVAPKGGALICAFKQLDLRYPTDPREDERELEDLLAAQPGWRAEVLRRRYLPRIEAVGVLPTAARGFAGRPQTRVPGLWNLYPSGTTLCRFGSLLAFFTATFRHPGREMRWRSVLVVTDRRFAPTRDLPNTHRR